MASPAPHATEPLEADDVRRTIGRRHVAFSDAVLGDADTVPPQVQAGNAGQHDDVDSAVALVSLGRIQVRWFLPRASFNVC